MKMVLAMVLTAILGTGALAGDYHTGGTLKCYQCHVMHATKSHLYADDPGDQSNPGGVVATNDHLLKGDTVSLCLSCHDGQDAIDVYGDAPQGGQPAHRSGGRFNNASTEPYAPFATERGHNLKHGAERAPGGSGTYNLDCASCHDPHGNSYYRNLKDLGHGGISYVKFVNDTSKDVFELKPYPQYSVQEAYEAANISYNQPDGPVHATEGFCVSCHTSIHNLSKQNGDWLKHPTIGYAKAYTVGTVSPLKTIGGRPAAGGTGNLIAGQVSCVTCHKAHGSTYSFGLIYDNRTTPEIEDAGPTDSIQATCKHCHAKGLTATQ